MSGNDRVKFWLLIACLAGASLYSFVYCFRTWRKNRVVEDTPTSRVRSAAQGYVEFTGQGLLLPESENKAPLSGIPCPWWCYKIEERSMRRRSWTTIQQDESSVPFVFDDGSGQCLIDPRGAEVFPAVKDVWYGDSEWPQICLPSGQGILDRLFDVFATGKYRYTEQRLLPHKPLYAIGSFRCLGGVSVESPDPAVAELLHDWKRDQQSLLARFDTNHDGILGADEWDRARAAARKQVMDTMASTPPSLGMSVMSKPTDGRAFLLAASDEETLARRLRRRAVAGIAIFVGSSSALTWLLTHV